MGPLSPACKWSLHSGPSQRWSYNGSRRHCPRVALIDPTSEIGRRSGVLWDGLQRRHTISASTASSSHRVAYLLCSFAAVKSWHFSAAKCRTKTQRPQCKQFFLKAFSRQFLFPSAEYATAAVMYEVWLILPVKVERVLGICKLWWVKNPLSTLPKNDFSRPWLIGCFVFGDRWTFFGLAPGYCPSCFGGSDAACHHWCLEAGESTVKASIWVRISDPEILGALALGKFHRDLMGNSCQKGGYRLWIFCVIFQKLTLFQYFSCDSRRSNGRICNCKLKILWCLQHFVASIVDVSILPISCWVSCLNCLSVETCWMIFPVILFLETGGNCQIQ